MSPISALMGSNAMEDSDAESHDEDFEEEEDEDHGLPAPQDHDDKDEESPLEAWRQVHSHLVRAIAIAREAVAAKKAQRRFWMEEICANLGEDGNLASTSVWMRPKPLKRAMVPKKALTKPKRTKQQDKDRSCDITRKQPPPAKRAKSSTPAKRGKTIRLKLPTDKARLAVEEATVQASVNMDDNSDTDDDDDDDDEEEEEEDAVEVDAQEIDDDDDAADHQNDNETEDEEESDEDGDDDNDDNGVDEDADQEMVDHYSPPSHLHNHPGHYPPHTYHHGHWGGHPTHPYMHATGYSPPAYPSYHPQDHYAGFYAGAGGMQSGLSSEGFYSTYSGPPVEGDEGDRLSHPPPPPHGIRAADSGSESDGGPTF